MECVSVFSAFRFVQRYRNFWRDNGFLFEQESLLFFRGWHQISFWNLFRFDASVWPNWFFLKRFFFFASIFLETTSPSKFFLYGGCARKCFLFISVLKEFRLKKIQKISCNVFAKKVGVFFTGFELRFSSGRKNPEFDPTRPDPTRPDPMTRPDSWPDFKKGKRNKTVCHSTH